MNCITGLYHIQIRSRFCSGLTMLLHNRPWSSCFGQTESVPCEIIALESGSQPPKSLGDADSFNTCLSCAIEFTSFLLSNYSAVFHILQTCWLEHCNKSYDIRSYTLILLLKWKFRSIPRISSIKWRQTALRGNPDIWIFRFCLVKRPFASNQGLLGSFILQTALSAKISTLYLRKISTLNFCLNMLSTDQELYYPVQATFKSKFLSIVYKAPGKAIWIKLTLYNKVLNFFGDYLYTNCKYFRWFRALNKRMVDSSFRRETWS